MRQFDMAKSTDRQFLPYEATSALQALGAHLRRARLARKDTQAVAAERCGLHAQTIARIEAGDPAVGIGKVFSVMVTYGMTTRLWGLSETDEATEILLHQHLPQRGRSAR
jgi:HTH-type transcriptional regulator/antitoxin HipB